MAYTYSFGPVPLETPNKYTSHTKVRCEPSFSPSHLHPTFQTETSTTPP